LAYSSIAQVTEVMGKVDVESKSVEVHNVSFSLHQMQKLESYSLHSCAKRGRKRYEKDGVLTFTPGLSKFTVAKYISNPFKFNMPFVITPKITVSSNQLKVKISLKPQEVAGQFLKVTDFFCKIHFPKFLSASTV
jgi:hypothetical protein